MAQDCNSSVVLLPIRPCYVKRIIDGTKRIEFRRKPFKRSVQNVVVYSTSPVRKIVALFTVSHITKAGPSEIWTKYHHLAGIDMKTFRDYFQGRDSAIAIGIGVVTILDPPISLRLLSGSLIPPQSFIYLRYQLFQKLCSRAKIFPSSRVPT